MIIVFWKLKYIPRHHSQPQPHPTPPHPHTYAFPHAFQIFQSICATPNFKLWIRPCVILPRYSTSLSTRGRYDTLLYRVRIQSVLPTSLAGFRHSSALPISRCHFPTNNARKTPVTRSFCVFFVSSKYDQSLPSKLFYCVQYHVILYHDIWRVRSMV